VKADLLGTATPASKPMPEAESTPDAGPPVTPDASTAD